jgi:DNA-directed RNA polymerase subunit RPC12/RpoP
MIKPYECSQCGSTDFLDTGPGQVRCSYCGSLFRVLTDEPKLTILKGAKVIFGKNANIEIHGDMEVQDGADVDVQGNVQLIKGGQKRAFKLELIEKGQVPYK